MQYKSRIRVWLMIPVCLLLAGCSNAISISIGTVWTKYQVAWWVAIFPFLVGIGFMSLGIFNRSWARWRRIGLVCCGTLIVLSLPFLVTGKVLVSNQGFKFGSIVGTRLVEFNEIVSVRIMHEADLVSDTERSPKEYMYIKLKDGGTVRFGLSDPVDHAAGKEIIKMMELNSIPITWAPGIKYRF